MRPLLIVLAWVSCFASDPLDTARLEAIHTQRVEWMKKRVVMPAQGVYHDYRAVWPGSPDTAAAKAADVQIFLGVEGSSRDGILFTHREPSGLPALMPPRGVDATNPKELKRLQNTFKEYPAEVFDAAGGHWPGHPELEFRYSSTHILARELTPSAVEESIAAGRAYAARDWLCDTAGFFFVAENNLGAYDIGDTAPVLNGTHLLVNLPIAGNIRILRDNDVVAEKTDSKLAYMVKEQGSYRAEVSLTIAGEQFSWITTNAIRIGKPDIPVSTGDMSPDVEIRRDIPYVDGGEAKRKLDIYLPIGKRDFPVMVFFHGGSWRSGDRAQYALFGNRFAKAGVGVVIPSYRLMPQNPYPAQLEDTAAAFAWVYRHIAEYGGDASRIYIAGHSTGGQLVSLLALDPSWLKKYDISPGVIRGVVSMSGIYDVTGIPELNDQNASPLHYVHPRTPPFLISYCQWDYLGLPKQARDFAGALQKEFDAVRLLYIPSQNHISEIVATLKDDDPTARAILDFVK